MVGSKKVRRPMPYIGRYWGSFGPIHGHIRGRIWTIEEGLT